MFTLEEAALLRFMLRVMMWLLVCVLGGGGCYAGVHWMHAHHYAFSIRHS